MGSPVSTVVANLYMEFFEELALESAPARPRLWKWYVDDTCCIIKRDAMKPLLHYLNDVHPTIKFNMEREKDGSLDTKLTQREDGTLNCLQKTDTHRQLLALLLLPPSKCKEVSHQESIDRARIITLQKDLWKELTTTFKQNSYPLPFIHAISSSLQRPTTLPEEPDEEQSGGEAATRSNPTCKRCEWIMRACEKLNLKVVFKSGPTLR